MHYKITIEYDGTNYVGWQAQIDCVTKSIEEILLEAIFKMTQEKVKLNCAGRTDAGVHAIAQVADFVVSKEFESFRIMMGLNQHLLDSNVVITNCEIVDENFHSRFDVKMRFYRYLIINRKARLALQRDRAWHVPSDLNIDDMKKAAAHLLGCHDFSAFRDSQCQAKSAIRTIEKIDIFKNNDEIIIEVGAKSFLHHMVRNIVGTLTSVGLGKISSDDMRWILESKDRTKSGQNAPAHGLYFLGASYSTPPKHLTPK